MREFSRLKSVCFGFIIQIMMNNIHFCWKLIIYRFALRAQLTLWLILRFFTIPRVNLGMFVRCQLNKSEFSFISREELVLLSGKSLRIDSPAARVQYPHVASLSPAQSVADRVFDKKYVGMVNTHINIFIPIQINKIFNISIIIYLFFF
jgi:hypothetical protein